MTLYCSSFPSIPAPLIHATKTSQLPNPPLNTSTNNSPPPSLLQRHHFTSKLHHLHQKLQPQTHNAHSTHPHSTRTYSHKCPPKKQPTPSPACQSYTTRPTHRFFASCKFLRRNPKHHQYQLRSLISYTKQLLSYPLQPGNNVSVLHNAINASSPATIRRQWCFILHFNTSDGTGRIAFPNTL
jgi:hypothetical protein